MKKLMIAAAIVCAAAFAQAGAVNWHWSGTVYNGYLNSGNTSTDYTGKGAQAGLMYVFNANAADVSQNAVLNAFLAGTSLESMSMDSFNSTDGKMVQGSSKKIAESHDTFPNVRIDTGVTPNAYYADVFYAMVVGDNIFISDDYSKKLGTTSSITYVAATLGSQSAKFQGEATKDSFTAGGWYSVVPEPTSGLLLLIGVGALALRRRRA